MGNCLGDDDEDDEEVGDTAKSGVKGARKQSKRKSGYRGLEIKEKVESGVRWTDVPLPEELLSKEFLIGPHEIWYLSLRPARVCKDEPRTRYLCFMGESHNRGYFNCPEGATNGNTPRVDDFLHALVTQVPTGVMSDIFLEVPFREAAPPKQAPPPPRSARDIVIDYHPGIQLIKWLGFWQTEKKEWDTGFIERIEAKFPKCFELDKSACKWSKFARFHYADVRRRAKFVAPMQLYYILQSLAAAFLKEKSEHSLRQIQEAHYQGMRIHQDTWSAPPAANTVKLFEMLEVACDPDRMGKWVSGMRKSLRIQKQQRNMCNPKTGAEIAAFFDKKIQIAIDKLHSKLSADTIANEVEYLRQVWANPDALIEPRLYSDVPSDFYWGLVSLLSDIDLYLMDEYTVSRMVRHFTDTPYPTVANGYFYGGSSHCEDDVECLLACPSLSARLVFHRGADDWKQPKHHCLALQREDLEKMRLARRLDSSM